MIMGKYTVLHIMVLNFGKSLDLFSAYVGLISFEQHDHGF